MTDGDKASGEDDHKAIEIEDESPRPIAEAMLGAWAETVDEMESDCDV